MPADLAGYVGQNLVPIGQLNLEPGIGESLDDCPFYLDRIFFLRQT